MNARQAQALADLLKEARPLRRWDDDPDPEVHATIQPVGGNSNDYQVTIFSPTDMLAHYPQAIFIDEAGKLYVYDADTDQDRAIEGFEWGSREGPGKKFDTYFDPMLKAEPGRPPR
jgi:hypothetical protein